MIRDEKEWLIVASIAPIYCLFLFPATMIVAHCLIVVFSSLLLCNCCS